MWRYFSLICVSAFLASAAFAGDIRYGYNNQGEYVPIEIDGQRVEYGYNNQGEYVPIAIGNKRVEQSFFSYGIIFEVSAVFARAVEEHLQIIKRDYMIY